MSTPVAALSSSPTTSEVSGPDSAASWDNLGSSRVSADESVGDLAHDGIAEEEGMAALPSARTAASVSDAFDAFDAVETAESELQTAQGDDMKANDAQADASEVAVETLLTDDNQKQANLVALHAVEKLDVAVLEASAAGEKAPLLVPVDKDDDVSVSSAAAPRSNDKGGDKPSHSSETNTADTDTDTDTIVTQPAPSPPPVSLVCLKSGLSSKASPLYLQSWIALSLTLDGRDKLTKLAQYLARTLAWYYKKHPQSAKWEATKGALTTARKAYRLGRTINEVQKLRQLGLIETVGWYLCQHSNRVLTHEHDNQGASSNSETITTVAQINRSTKLTINNLLQRLHGVLFTIYRPIASTLSFSGDSCKPPAMPLSHLIGSALKIVGLAGFWACDNMSYLSQIGLLDNFNLTDKSRLTRRKLMQAHYSIWANRFYFGGSVAGLVVSFKAYWMHYKKTLKQVDSSSNKETDNDNALETARIQQFTLFLALVKSVCDVLVFSNNPGIDLWKHHAGYKMNEGVHCLCGLLSASTVLYNNYPNAAVKKCKSTA
jgi:Peroxisomal biogenesis factor 11 (PEX11)